ncbi:hypothetical protein ncot_13490 [Nocardioides sp. JQ2195]|uniref:hypothetical protein n=1 Tax=Nocardioides sp. JQ2195 TaxID=2592334 RepID=UPI00143E1054|nr:hypothetical protein [Nocardioides sp. JQ2195]QIX27509.1 hypothetical protein ncot_13490 [Nocardioides sp. JQ2195]
MTSSTDINRDAFLDAIAFTRCRLNNDTDGLTAVAMACEPVEMVEALASLYIANIMELVAHDPRRVDLFLKCLQSEVSAPRDESGR